MIDSGNEAPFFMIAYFVMSGVLLRAFSPPFGRCKFVTQPLKWNHIILIFWSDTAIEQKLEGDFRFTHVSTCLPY